MTEAGWTAGAARAPFIVFEGLDGSGKSTCARRLAAAIGAEYLTTPSPAVRAVREAVVDSFQGDQAAAQLFYLATVFDASSRVARLQAQGRAVVLDRYFVSTLAYAAFRGSPLALEGLQAHLWPADVTVFLDVAWQERARRLAARGATAADRETLGEAPERRLLAAHAALRGLPVVGRWLPIQADGVEPEAVVAQVRAALAVSDGRRAARPPA